MAWSPSRREELLFNTDVYDRVFEFALRDFTRAASALRALIVSLTKPKISVSALSDDWCREHERDSVKH